MGFPFQQSLIAQVAQLVEQDTENVWVVGSNLTLGDSFDFGEDIKQAALLIHARVTRYT